MNKPENCVSAYIASAPKEVQPALKELRALIRTVAPTATERTDYFQMPGYSDDQYTYYNGMFVWFSFKKSYVRIHVLPSVIQKHTKELEPYPATKSVVSFSIDKKIPPTLIKKLVRESRKAMKLLSGGKK